MRPDDAQIEAITTLVRQARAGDAAARDRLFAAVYEELKRLAGRLRAVDAPGGTMSATTVVNELWIEFDRCFPPGRDDQPADRAAFFHAAAQAMRRIACDYHRRWRAEKRGGGLKPAAIDAMAEPPDPDAQTDHVDYLALDEAMTRLAAVHPRWHDVVMLRYFAGRTIEETAAVLGVAESTVSSDWKLARAWLRLRVEGRCG